MDFKTYAGELMGMIRNITLLGVCITTVACQDLNQPLPPGTIDPNTFKTVGGAVSAYKGALKAASHAVREYVDYSALFTDEGKWEYSTSAVTMFAGRVPPLIDARNIPDDDQSTTSLYRSLHAVRTNADQAIGLLRMFPGEVEVALQADLYIWKGFSILLLAEMFCSGIPLSTVDFDGDFTYKPGLSTDELLTVAVQQFDSAVLLAPDSVTIRQVAAIGSARALLSLGKLDEAAEKARLVSKDFRYELPLLGDGSSKIATVIADREGGNGLPFQSSLDPRSRVILTGISEGDSLYAPVKYFTHGDTAKVQIASYVEAVLIQAEADLNNDDSRWLDLLNSLRTDGSYRINTSGDTIWNAGDGKVEGLEPLPDPAMTQPLFADQTPFDIRLDLLFAERAYWFFVDGHRQGDLRRLIRHYNRDADSVYPSGQYGGPLNYHLQIRYGSDVTAPVPLTEAAYNRLYKGCQHRGA